MLRGRFRQMSRLAGWRGRRAGWAVTAGLALVTGMLVAGYPAAQAASARADRAGFHDHQVAGRAFLSAAQASARAQKSGKPVVASALTTPTSQTIAKPGGMFTTTETLLPARAFRNGTWRALDPDLRWNGNHTLSPAVTTDGLVLSGGGSGPLAVLASYGRSMSLLWPTRLPVPSVAGPTATYRDVLPGVNLEVTVNPQGGLSDVLVIRNAAAAANPALRSLRLRTATSQDLHVSADAAGNLRVATGAQADPVFTALAPQMWDSAKPPANAQLVRESGAGLVEAPTGMPAYSTAGGPGAGARVWRVPLSVSGTTILLAAPRSALTARGLVYPLYIDPSFEADPVGEDNSAWTQVDSGYATTSYWDESSDLQVGLCPAAISPAGACGPGNGLGVARSFFRVPIPSQLTTSTSINSADLYMTDVYTASCTKESLRLYTTGIISSSTTWDDQPAWSSGYSYQDVAFGYNSSCPYHTNDITWNVASTIAGAVANHYPNQTWGLRSYDESLDLAWWKLESGKSAITLSVSYHNPPNKPTGLENAPAGACATSQASESTIGADDVTLSATVGDVDNANGDDSLATTFTVKSYATGDTVDTIKVDSGNDAGGLTVSTAVPRATIEGWSSDGTTTAYSYYWYATTSDDGSPVLTSPQSDTCYFLYNPLGPAAPDVSVSASTVAIGTTFSATFTPQSGCSATTTPCPATFTYQLGAGAPVTVTPNNNPASGDWTGNITMSHVGPIQLTAYGTASGGNPGTTDSTGMTGAPPATPYPDGYFAGGSYPSLLTLGTGTDPSLWLSVGTGNGTLAAPVDIGSLGTMINPGSDGPGDWTDTLVPHGDFTGSGVQDVMAYYASGTHAGNGVIIGGQGDASPLIPANATAVTQPALSDPTFDNPDDYPTSSLVGAGDASETDAGLDDLIGVLGDSTSSELALFSVSGACSGDGVEGGYAYCQTLSTTAPDGTADWYNYTLAAAQPAGNRDAVVLFALDKNGALYVSVNPTCNETASSPVTTGCEENASSTSGTSGTLVGMDWTKAWTTPWGVSAPDLVSADVNNADSVELWAVSDGTAVPYTANFSTDTVTKESSGSPLAYPDDDWQLNDGSSYALGSSATTALDSITGDAATINGSCTGTCFWGDDSYFSTISQYDGSTTYVAPPAGLIPSSATSASISIWFKTTTPDGVLVSVQADALSSGSTTPDDYNPVLYVGSDGLLQATWWPAPQLASKAPVDDGLWHHAVLTDTGGTETLTLDGVVQGTASGSAEFSYASSTHLAFGAGYIGGAWRDEPHASSSSDTGYLMYFNGQLADAYLNP
jgi:hypothetical protein